MRISEQDKAFLLSLAYATGMILLWKGIWEGIGIIPYIGRYLGNPFVSGFIGLLILTLSGWIYGAFDVFAIRANNMARVLGNVLHDAKRGIEHSIYYYDELTKKHHRVPAHKVSRVEQNHIVFEHEGKEVFIPLHRISHIRRKGKMLWRK